MPGGKPGIVRLNEVDERANIRKEVQDVDDLHGGQAVWDGWARARWTFRAQSRAREDQDGEQGSAEHAGDTVDGRPDAHKEPPSIGSEPASRARISASSPGSPQQVVNARSMSAQFARRPALSAPMKLVVWRHLSSGRGSRRVQHDRIAEAGHGGVGSRPTRPMAIAARA